MDTLARIVSEMARQPDIDSIEAATKDALDTPGNQAHVWLLEQLGLFLQNHNHEALLSDDVLLRIKPVALRLVELGGLSAETFDSEILGRLHRLTHALAHVSNRCRHHMSHDPTIPLTCPYLRRSARLPNGAGRHARLQLRERRLHGPAA